MSQTISIPNGYYRLRAQAALTDYTGAYDGANYPVVYAADQTTPFQEMQGDDRGSSMTRLSSSFSAHKYYTAWIPVTVTSGSLTIGVKGTRTNTWCIWDNFQLEYLGPIDLSAYRDALAAAVAKAEAVEGTVPAAAYSAIAAVVTENNKTYGDGDGYSAAISAIDAAIATYASTEIVNAYANYNALKAQAQALDDDATVFTGDATVDVSAADEAVEAATDVAGINAAIPLLRSAAATFLGAVTVNEGQYFDITSVFLTNADFSAGNIGGWETNYVSGQQANNIGYQGASYTNGDVTISKFIEAWRWSPALGDGYLRQTVSGLPEGKYTLEADAIATDQPGGSATPTGAYLYINADGVDYKTQLQTANEKPQHFSTEFLSPGDVDVTFGLKTESTTANWLCADNFVVKFYGIDLSPYATLLAEAVAEAEAVKETVNTAAANALAEVVTANNKAWSTSKEYSTAIAAIQAATNKAKAIPAAIASYNAAKPAIQALYDVSDYEELVAGAHNALGTALAYNPENATDATDIEAAEAALKVAAYTYITNANPTGNAQFDLTFMLTNPDLTGLGNGAKEGWYTDQTQPSQNSQAMTTNNAVANSSDNTKYAMYEYWSNSTEATNGFTVYQKVTLPAGTYKMEALCVAGYGSGNRYSTADTRYITFSANETDGTRIMTSTLEPASLEFVNDGENEVKIGLKAHEGNTSNWMGIGYVQFYKVAKKVIEISENADYTPESAAGTVQLTRTINVGMNTVALPFALTAEQVAEVFGEGSVVYSFQDVADGENSTINFTTTSAIAPNTPVLVKATQANNGTEPIVIENATVAAGEAKVAGTNFDFVGTYAASTTIPENDYFISGVKVWKSAGATTIKGTRAYIQAKNTAAGDVKLFIDGIATSISEIEGEAVANDGAIYNLAGQRVEKAQKGIYVVGGRKVVIK